MMKSSIRLYKFTGAKFALENIEKQRLKISFPDEVNDIFELKPFCFANREMRQKWHEHLVVQSKTHGFISFSSAWDNPTMWGHYAENHQGVCYGVEVSLEHATQIQYVPDLRQFNPDALEDELKYATDTKSSHWVYEHEWRTYIGLDSNQIIQRQVNPTKPVFQEFCKKLALKEIIIGARSQIKGKEFRKILPNRNVQIKVARADYQNFKIVKERSK